MSFNLFHLVWLVIQLQKMIVECNFHFYLTSFATAPKSFSFRIQNRFFSFAVIPRILTDRNIFVTMMNDFVLRI